MKFCPDDAVYGLIANTNEKQMPQIDECTEILSENIHDIGADLNELHMN